MAQSTFESATSAAGVPVGGAMNSPMSERANGSGGASPRIHRFAEKMHRAIDGVEHRLSSRGDALRTSRYREQALDYGEKLRERFDAQPLQSAGLVLAAGVVLDRLFLRKTKVRLVKVPVPVRVAPVERSVREADLRALRWRHAAGLQARRMGDTAREASARVGTAAGLGLGSARMAASVLAEKAGTLPLHMRVARERLLARSQEYGSVAKSGLQAHPLAGLGAVLGASGLLTAALMQRRQPAPAYGAGDSMGSGLGWRRNATEGGGGLREGVAAHPVTGAVVLLGLGALAGALLRSR